MVVIAASIYSKTRKAYFSRHFVDVKGSRIQNLISVFTSVKTTGTQHSFVEMDGVRFLYQPLDEVIVVILTNKNSNIYLDLKVLSLLANVTTEICKCSKEDVVMKKAFEIMMCFDEVISRGCSENVKLEDVMVILTAESSDEKLHNEISKSKEKGAKEELRRKARMMKQQKNESSKSSLLQQASEIGRGVQITLNRLGQTQLPVSGIVQPYIPLQQQPVVFRAEPLDRMVRLQAREVVKEKKKLSAPRFAEDRDQTIVHESEMVDATVTRDGNTESLLIKGGLSLKVINKDKSDLRLEVNLPNTPNFSSKTHPYIDKKIFNTQSALVLAHPSKTFPINQSLDVLKWKYSVTDESKLPIIINFWISPSDLNSSVTVEYELILEDLQLRKIEVRIPIPPGCAPIINDYVGKCDYNKSSSVIIWLIGDDSPPDSSGILEFTIDTDDSDLLFPMGVSFVGYSSYSNLKVNKICNPKDKVPINFSEEYLLLSDKYEII